MIIKRIVQNLDGDVEATFALTKEQEAMLLNYAITNLVTKGMVEVSDVPREEWEQEKITTENDLARMFLEALDPKSLPEA